MSVSILGVRKVFKDSSRKYSDFDSVNNQYMVTKDLCLMALHIVKSLHWDQSVYIYNISKYFEKVICIHDCQDDLSIPHFLKDKISFIYSESPYLDVGKYLHVIKTLDISSLERIALINDSCKLYDSLDEVFSKGSGEVWGITDSFEISHHLQSYFIVCTTPKSIHLLKKFLTEVLKLDAKDKKSIVLAWEIGLSKYFIENNIELKALYTLGREYINPSYSGSDKLFELGCPVIKKFRINPDVKYTVNRHAINPPHLM